MSSSPARPPLFDFHCHGGDASRTGGIAAYIREEGLSGLVLLSLPTAGVPGAPEDPPHFNAAVLESKRRLADAGVPVYAFGCLDHRPRLARLAAEAAAGAAEAVEAVEAEEAEEAVRRAEASAADGIAAAGAAKAAGAASIGPAAGAAGVGPASAAAAPLTGDNGAEPPGAASSGPRPGPRPESPAAPAAQVAALAEAGFDGLKLWAGKPELAAALNLLPDDPYLVEACREAGRLGLPVIFHVADPPEFWRPEAGGLSLAGRDVPDFEDFIDGAARLCREAPRAVLVFPHLLFLADRLERLDRFLEEAPNAMLDLAPGNYFYAELARNPEAASAFFARRRKRILFGSDGFFFPPEARPFAGDSLESNRRRCRRLAEFLSEPRSRRIENPYPLSRETTPEAACLGLTDSVLGPILSGNARRLLPRSPKPVREDL